MKKLCKWFFKYLRVFLIWFEEQYGFRHDVYNTCLLGNIC